jgi:RNA polymerase sigma-70 factor (ECF subfamily)
VARRVNARPIRIVYSSEASFLLAHDCAVRAVTIRAVPPAEVSEDPASGLAPVDVELVERARRGDNQAFEALYHRFVGMVHGVVLARVARPDVDDLVQDVFLTAFRRIGTLREAATFPGWLAAIARNRAIDHLRALPRGDVPLVEEAAAPGGDRAEALAVLAVVRSLPLAYRETLVLRLVEGMTGPEIAARTGLTPASVRVNLHRGMKLLRARLQGGGTDA